MERKAIKCVVWDLDHTVWHGVLLEDETVTLRPEVVEIIKTLDQRGILQSIASKNEHTRAMEQLTEFGLADYFLYPQIHWNSKATMLAEIAKELNIALDTFAFVDDQPFEREEVNFSHADVLCIDAAELDGLLERAEMNPRFITDESKIRRQMYRSDLNRKQAERGFVGPQDEFLATLEMVLTIAPAEEEDLQRAEELTMRTNQLNTTGYTYSYDELDQFRRSDQHRLWVAGLDDKYGAYGKIGLALVECREEVWVIKLLLMSCRVMSRGVGSVLMNHIMRQAKEAGVRLVAEFKSNNRNRMMYVSYKFAGFREVEQQEDWVLFEHDLQQIPTDPQYVVLLTEREVEKERV